MGIQEERTESQKQADKKVLQKLIEKLDPKKPTKLNPLENAKDIDLLNKIRSAQLSHQKVENIDLKRFGEIFFTNENNISSIVTSTPPYYVVNNNDTFSITLYGLKNEVYELSVDEQGNINIPKIGPLHVGQETFSEATKKIQSLLKKSYQSTDIYVTLVNSSSIQVSLTGYVNHPGVYNLSSFATVKDLLIQARGINENGSLREISILRDGKLYQKIDLYSLMLGKESNVNTLLKSNDIVHIPRTLKQIKIYGAVYKEAIFELKNNEDFNDLISYCGGFKAEANKNDILMNRYVENHNKRVIQVSTSDLKKIDLVNEDTIYVYSIDKASNEAIYLFGNVLKPGEKELPKNRSLHTFFKKLIGKNSLDKVFLENTSYKYGLIKRMNDNLSVSVVGFNLKKILDGRKDVKLKKKDEIYIFNKLDNSHNATVQIAGKVVSKPGKYQYYDGLTVYDLVSIAGTNSEYDSQYIKVSTKDQYTFMPHTVILNADESKKYVLREYDNVEIFDYFFRKEKTYVQVSGNVYSPSKYPYDENMTLENLIDLAGGNKKYTFTDYVKIVRVVENDGEVNGAKYLYPELNSLEPFKLKNRDQVYVYNIEEKEALKQVVNISGAVKKPGRYDISADVTLYDVLMAAGFNRQIVFSEYIKVKRAVIIENCLEEANYLFPSLKESTSFKLKSKDQIYVYNIKEKEALKQAVNISGAVKKPGRYDISADVTLYDVLMAAGFNRQIVFSEYIKVKRAVIIENDLEEAKYLYPSLEESRNFKLKKDDTIYVYSIQEKKERKEVVINGAVVKPGAYLISGDTTIMDIIKASDGLKDEAKKEEYEIVRKKLGNKGRIVSDIFNIKRMDAESFILQDQDQINVQYISGYDEIREVTIEGEVLYPGRYIIRNNERLTDIILRAGGFTDAAHSEASVFTRESIKKVQVESMKSQIDSLKESAINMQMNAPKAGEEEMDFMPLIQTVQELEATAKKYQPIGRISLKINRDFESINDSSSNILLENGDKLVVPRINETVLVIGEVMNSSAIVYDSDEFYDYIESVGGYTEYANEDNIYIIHPDGMSSVCDNGFLSSSCDVQKGDVLVVPKKLDTYSSMKFTQDIAQIMYQFSLTAAAMVALGVL